MKRSIRDVSKDIISNNEIERIHKEVLSSNYGKEDSLISSCLKKFPYNTDRDIVAMKVGLIDITNSTNISRYKSKINVVEVAECIIGIKEIDLRISSGDPTVVSEIARANGKINLFCFASKYCCYHNVKVYRRDDYSIFDDKLKEYLPEYFKGEITKKLLEKYRSEFKYKEYNDFITKKLDDIGITLKFRKRKFDRFVWYLNRKN